MSINRCETHLHGCEPDWLLCVVPTLNEETLNEEKPLWQDCRLVIDPLIKDRKKNPSGNFYMILYLTLTTLWANSADGKLMFFVVVVFFFFVILDKLALTFHGNCLHLFWGKIRKLFQIVVC